MSRKIVPLVLLAVFLSSNVTQAASGSWAYDSNGNWSDTTKWVGGLVANGVDSTANFTIDVSPGDGNVTLDTNRTIGNLTFGLVWSLPRQQLESLQRGHFHTDACHFNRHANDHCDWT